MVVVTRHRMIRLVLVFKLILKPNLVCCRARLYVLRKSDIPLYFGQILAFYFDTTPYTLNDNVNTKSFDRCLPLVLY